MIAVLIVLLTAGAAQAQTFERVETYPDAGRFDFILAVADLNGDGRDDIVAGGWREHHDDGQPDDRYTKTALGIFLGREDGTLEYAPDLVDGVIEARQAVVVAADLDNDEQIDLAVFDVGVYVGEESVGYGNPPQLWLRGDDGRLRASEALADAVRAEHEARPPGGKGLSAPADLHIKTATAGDIDNDGDLDLWVESSGGKNVVSHFMVNNGDGTFTIERDRATHLVFRNHPPDWWRHVGHAFVDVDNDGDLDLALGQIQTDDLRAGYSIVVVNDGTGHFPSRIELPDPDFNDGYTTVHGLAHHDINDDGFEDLLIVNQRDGPPEILAFTGRYIQALMNDSGEAFVDETTTWMGDQSLAAAARGPDGNTLGNHAYPQIYDINRDGCKDIVMTRSEVPIRPESPIFYLNNGSGQFRPVSPPEMFTSLDGDGRREALADINGDGLSDLLIPHQDIGPDDVVRTDDDLTWFITFLNTTPAGPERCG